MKIIELINDIKDNCSHNMWGHEIREETTRDKILYGDPNVQCKGVVTTLFASYDVILKTIELGYNFIICHEAAFYNHGDHTEWLMDNETFLKKKELLDKYEICIWRMHDYIHAGLKINGEYKDGIFYGLANILGWKDYIISDNPNYPDYYNIPLTPVKDVAQHIMNKFNLSHIRFIGDKNTKVSKIYFPMHIMGEVDNEVIKKVNKENIDCLITMEMSDYTVNEYIRDAAKILGNKCILAVGHFNVEEPGMSFLNDYLKEKYKDIDYVYIQSGETYSYLTKGESYEI